ncbi:MAG: 1-phosphofructokinase family hexose kinase [Kiritimatiellaeota bacterium]|nr:1-phosphofructokinase family hexose kinase [Kiritimatiellota bacterium]
MAEQLKKPVLCVGITPCVQRTLQFPRLELGEVNRARAVTISAGGKACTLANVLRTLGEDPLVTGLLGGDTGVLVENYLRQRAITCDFVVSDQPTRICSTVLDEATGQVTELVEEAALPSPDDWCQFDGKLAGLLVRCGMVVISGALPPNAPDYTYANIAQKAATLNVPLLIDSQKAPLMNTLAYQPLLVKLNQRELAETCQTPVASDEDLIKAGHKLLARGAQWVLVTQSAAPAWLLSSKEIWQYQPPRIKAVNPIGCGDSVSAGVACALRLGRPMSEATRLGIACGSADALTLVPGEVTTEDVERLYAEVTVRRMA